MVFHQVRDPMKVISSFSKYCGHNQLWAMACSVTPELIPYWNSDQQKSTRYKHNFNTCTKLMMYHWVSWNKIISLHADWTYRIENTTLYSICSRAFKKYPTISEKCKSIEGRSEKLEIRRNSKQFHGRVVLTPSILYKIDCELARKVFVTAVSFGYLNYSGDIREC